ncbi:ABC transporter ATP-binding protein [Streptosporangium sp. NPDC051023]|uniref:ABC transporter ATP-binding protein n=1 Tax=Streptosporangium sp. NPDC051023 TaxID=3155410 RepID=UPI00344C14D1
MSGRYQDKAANPPNAPVVQVEGLTVTAPGGRPLIRNAGLELRPGRLVALTGPSGSGKTTLLRAVIGLLPPGATRVAGRVEVLGRDILGLAEHELRELRGKHLAYVGQDPASGLNPRMRVRSLIREVAVDRNPDAVATLLAEVRLADGDRLAARRPGALSGGQQRRVALARALARRPDVLLLDEPTAGLHPELREEIGALLRHLAHTRRLAVAFSCHDADLVARLADDVVELGVVTHRPTARAARVTDAEEARAVRAPALQARGVEVIFGRPGKGVVPTLRGVDLTIAPGSSTGVVGASGSGKTTLVRAIVGLQPLTAGTIVFDGTSLRPGLRGRSRAQRRRIQLVTQNPLGALNPSHTAGAAISRPLRLHRRCPAGDVPTRVADLLRQVGLSPAYADRYPHELSGGQRQRVSIARALAAEPDVLICDEVTSALDAATAESIMDLLMGLRDQHDLALVLISHDLPLIADRTETVTVLDAGVVAESGPTAHVFANPTHPATRALLSRTMEDSA